MNLNQNRGPDIDIIRKIMLVAPPSSLCTFPTITCTCWHKLCVKVHCARICEEHFLPFCICAYICTVHVRPGRGRKSGRIPQFFYWRGRGGGQESFSLTKFRSQSLRMYVKCISARTSFRWLSIFWHTAFIYFNCVIRTYLHVSGLGACWISVHVVSGNCPLTCTCTWSRNAQPIHVSTGAPPLWKCFGV